MVAKTTYHLKIAGTTFAEIKAFKSRVTAIAADLGYEEITGDPPEGRTVIKGRSRAVQNGCFPLVLEYRVTGVVGQPNKTQTTTVLCSPEKADTARNAVASKTYNGKQIVNVRGKQRRILVA